MIFYEWGNNKNEILKKERHVSFEQAVMHIEKGDLIDIIEHPNKNKYPNQKVLIININDYVYSVPFVEKGDKRYLKTVVPSRKLTKLYLR